MAEAERAVDIQLPGLSESAAAYQRADHLHQGVSEHLKQIDDLTQSHSGKVPLSGRRTYSPDVARARVLIRNPRTVRQAIIASLIFGPPRALEE